MDLSLGEIAAVLGVPLENAESVVVNGVSTDSRTLKKGMVFFALRGEKFDGHCFVDEVFQKGACGVVVDREWESLQSLGKNQVIFRVADPLKSLQEIASFYRQKFRIPVIAVTGTNGKTTTKEMISEVLRTRYRVMKSPGNFNNHIGVALSVCEWQKSGEIAILEMGTNHFGEIRSLCEIARPTHGVITNIGKGHLEFFHNIEGVVRAKAELLDYLKEEGTAFLNADDSYLRSLRNRVCKTVTYGFSGECDIQGDEAEIDKTGFPRMKLDGEMVRLSVQGYCNLYNALAAAAVGWIFVVPWNKIRDALRNYGPMTMRMELFKLSGMVVLNDAYNANPSSVHQALMTLQVMNGLRRRIAVLGDMLELGESSLEEHRRIGELVVELGIDAFFGYGPDMRIATDRARDLGLKMTFHFESKADLLEAMHSWLEEGDGILVKGSRGMKMEEVVEGIICSKNRGVSCVEAQ